MLQPVGPVVVFTASNFPLAFSTAGGDTASALAAGNPVIVKAHESHLATNQLVSEAIQKAAQRCGMPDGVFSSLIGSGYELGQKLVLHPNTRSVAFTGSFRGGKALFDLAIGRDQPVPVFAEMGSVNPVVLLPGILQEKKDALATELAGSVTLGVGQFCTNPGVIIGVKGQDLSEFIDLLRGELKLAVPGNMLNEGIRKNYSRLKNEVSGIDSVEVVAEVPDADDGVGAMVVSVGAGDFISNPKLHEEVFGPFTMIIICDGILHVEEVIRSLKGQLTITIDGEDVELEENKELIDAAKDVAGRVIFNGVPTGGEGGYAMHHGGPFPATTDSRFTSVGADAIKRFCRPVCFQDMPQSLLPDELKNTNPMGIWRQVDGEYVNGTL
jgi:NADP-dependent aldehyde dehydrogenase